MKSFAQPYIALNLPLMSDEGDTLANPAYVQNVVRPVYLWLWSYNGTLHLAFTCPSET